MNLLNDVQVLQRKVANAGFEIIHIGTTFPDDKKHNTIQVRSNGDVYMVDRCGLILKIIGAIAIAASLKGVVDGGGDYDPVSLTNTFQHELLKNLGGIDGRIRIYVDDIPMSSWGSNKSFDYVQAEGRITFLGYIWQNGSSFEAALNQ